MLHHKHHSREEIAKIEIGHTDSTRGKNRFLVVLFLVVICGIPLLQTARDVRAIRSGAETTRRFPQCLDIISVFASGPAEPEEASLFGSVKRANARMMRAIDAYETELKQRDVFMGGLIPLMQIPVTAWLKGGNEDAYCGRNGWLFYRRDIDSLTARGFLEPEVLARRAASGSELKAPPQPDPLKAIVDFRDQLAVRDIALMVVPVPVKPTLYPEHYSSRYDREGELVQNPSFGEFLDRLDAAGIAYLDPAPLLLDAKQADAEQLLYLKTDTHWTPVAMELVARELARKARATAALPPANRSYAELEAVVTNRGDIAGMLNLPERMETFLPESVLLHQLVDGDAFWRSDPSAEVLFLGDSFANIYSLPLMGWGEAAGLAEHVSGALGLPVDAITRNDGGSHATREMLSRELARGHDRLAGKKLVIWEFAARELVGGDWKLLPMDLGERQDVGFYRPAQNQTVEVDGIVKAIAPVPRPGTVPYKDHIVMVHLVGLSSEEDAAAVGREAVCLAWSMRDNTLTAAARCRPGDRVKVRVQSWREVGGRYEAINRSELDDDALMLAEPIWAEWPVAADGSQRDANPPAVDPVSPAPTVPIEVGAVTGESALGDDQGQLFREQCARRAAAGEQMSVEGSDGWLFLRAGLRHLGVGTFWGDVAAAVSQSTRPDRADPLPALVDFNNQLKEVGIELLLVPVPPKAVIYPDKLFPEEFSAAEGRLDDTLQEFYRLLEREGLNVLDLTPVMLDARREGGMPDLYCRTDTHWSAYACELAAKRIRARIESGSDWYVKPEGEWLFAEEATALRFRGDLARSLQDDGAEEETIAARRITPVGTHGVMADDSPVLLLGDSHTLVFHEGGEMLATEAGLADQLAFELGIPIDIIGVYGSAATPARVNLLRRARRDPGYLAGKKLIIYCFAAREFTESQGWARVPVVKPTEN